MTCKNLTRRAALAVLVGLASSATAGAGGPDTASGSTIAGGAAYGANVANEPTPTELGPGERLLAGSGARVTYSQGRLGDVVEAIRLDDDTVVRRWAVTANTATITWDGTYGGQPVRTGNYAFRVAGQATAATVDTASSFVVVDSTFPITGQYEFGALATNGFGGGRGHQGNDIFADCGAPLVAVRAARVQTAASQSRAGNYIVLQDADGESFAYMHMRDRALLDEGDRVRAGQLVGYVGQTGRASGCHLHFEHWTAPGWYEGGRAIDPRPILKRWQSWTTEAAPPTTRRASARSRR